MTLFRISPPATALIACCNLRVESRNHCCCACLLLFSGNGAKVHGQCISYLIGMVGDACCPLQYSTAGLAQEVEHHYLVGREASERRESSFLHSFIWTTARHGLTPGFRSPACFRSSCLFFVLFVLFVFVLSSFSVFLVFSFFRAVGLIAIQYKNKTQKSRADGCQRGRGDHPRPPQQGKAPLVLELQQGAHAQDAAYRPPWRGRSPARQCCVGALAMCRTWGRSVL